jgi:predicted RNA-binding Zn-ribbon protein involved in translation (DUF1610 family)
MERWVLNCEKCNVDIAYSEVEKVRDPFAAFIKPEFPNGGLKIDCPNCGETSIYQRHQLVYRASPECESKRDIKREYRWSDL